MIQHYLNWLFDKVFIPLVIQCVLYFILLAAFSLDPIIDHLLLWIVSFVINILFLIYELSQLIILGWTQYFESIVNYMDISVHISIVVYLVYDEFFDNDPDNQHDAVYLLYAVILLLAWTRGLSFFRTFKPTRYFI